jgi:N-acetylmuramoyl-L-alanine amidase
LKVKTIIIDPGHGGKDPGAVYPNGMQEKDITLDIAFKLKQLLLQDGAYKVLLTREDDIFIPLEERTAYANRQNGDLFISIHVNSTTYAANSGIETYYLSLAEDDESRAVAVYENRTATTRYSNLEKLLENIMKNSKIEESAHFADTIQKNLINKSHQQDRGVKKAGFYVLIGANMPSILTEVGFLSNGKDNKLLNNTFYREMIAKALYRGIKDYTYSLLALSENN